MQTATISSKFQICIPKTIRDELEIKAGQTFIFITIGNSLQLVPRHHIKEMRGIMAGADTSNVRDRKDRV